MNTFLKCTLATLLLLATLTLTAQDTTQTAPKPKTKRWGIGLGFGMPDRTIGFYSNSSIEPITLISGGTNVNRTYLGYSVFINYNIKNNLRLSITSNNTILRQHQYSYKNNLNDLGAYDSTTIDSKFNIYGISATVGYYKKNKRLEYSLDIGPQFFYYTNAKIKNFSITGSSISDEPKKTESITAFDGGYSIGLNLSPNINYKITKWLGVGLKSNFYGLYSNYGDNTQVINKNIITGEVISIFDTINKTKGLYFYSNFQFLTFINF